MKESEKNIIAKKEKWLERRTYSSEVLSIARKALEEIQSGKDVLDALRHHPLPTGGYLGKHALIKAYQELVSRGEWAEDNELLAKVRMKPIRTLSGVATVTVLTEPYPCPHHCIFCPQEEGMPKSYLQEEPGAKRAYENDFDPYRQVKSRLQSLEAVGHPTEKVELLILGGTWTAYPKDYQEWFVRRCFDALNSDDKEEPAENLKEAHQLNITAAHRNVGLVIETRPDEINVDMLKWLRYLGVTKVQMGAQSCDDSILALNQRGHNVAQTRQAAALLRAAGFKFVLHWMPNLLGSTPERDKEDFSHLWYDLCPDELKIYPTQLLESAPLYNYWVKGEYQPYSTETLIELLAEIKPTIPRYCRVNRVIRDIPSPYVVAGNKRTSLRLDVHERMKMLGNRCQCIRCREVRSEAIHLEDLLLEEIVYAAGGSEEHFLSFVTPEDKIAGFLRLSLPGKATPKVEIDDLEGAAIIREVHVYGQALAVGEEQHGAAQHIGLGSRLIDLAKEIAKQKGFARMAVISAVGTRQYYQRHGFEMNELYQVCDL